MPKAIHAHTTSRRTLLGAAAAVPPAALPVAAAAEPGGDAELLRLVGEFQRHRDRYLELTIAHANVAHIPREVDAELDALVSVKHDLAEQIAELHATDDLLGWSIARDLAGDEAAQTPERQARWRGANAPVTTIAPRCRAVARICGWSGDGIQGGAAKGHTFVSPHQDRRQRSPPG